MCLYDTFIYVYMYMCIICVSMTHILTSYDISSDPLPAVYDREGEAALVLQFTMYPTMDALNRPPFLYDTYSDSL